MSCSLVTRRINAVTQRQNVVTQRHNVVIQWVSARVCHWSCECLPLGDSSSFSFRLYKPQHFCPQISFLSVRNSKVLSSPSKGSGENHNYYIYILTWMPAQWAVASSSLMTTGTTGTLRHLPTLRKHAQSTSGKRNTHGRSQYIWYSKPHGPRINPISSKPVCLDTL